MTRRTDVTAKDTVSEVEAELRRLLNEQKLRLPSPAPTQPLQEQPAAPKFAAPDLSSGEALKWKALAEQTRVRLFTAKNRGYVDDDIEAAFRAAGVVDGTLGDALSAKRSPAPKSNMPRRQPKKDWW